MLVLGPDAALWGVWYHFGFVYSPGSIIIGFYLCGCSLTKTLPCGKFWIPVNAGRVLLVCFILTPGFSSIWGDTMEGLVILEKVINRPLKCPLKCFVKQSQFAQSSFFVSYLFLKRQNEKRCPKKEQIHYPIWRSLLWQNLFCVTSTALANFPIKKSDKTSENL